MWYSVLVVLIALSIWVIPSRAEITGRVIDTEGLPIFGVIVTLGSNKVCDTTDTLGEYAIAIHPTGSSSRIGPASRHRNIVDHNGVWLPAGEKATVTILNIAGRVICKKHLPNGKFLRYTELLPVGRSCSMYILSVHTSSAKYLVNVIGIDSKTFAVRYLDADQAAPRVLLQKSAQAQINQDTLLFRLFGYIDNTHTIHSSDTRIDDVILNRASSEAIDSAFQFVSNTQDSLSMFYKKEDDMTPFDSICAQMHKWLSCADGIDTLITFSNGIEIRYSSGLTGGLVLINDSSGYSDTSTSQPSGQALLKSAKSSYLNSAITRFSGSDIIGNNRVLIWAPYEHDWGQYTDPANSNIGILENSRIGFNLDLVKDELATVSRINTLTDYGLVIFDTHGLAGNYIFTSEAITPARNAHYRHSGYLPHKLAIFRVHQGRKEYFDHYAVRSFFIQTLPGEFPNSVIFNASCQSTRSEILWHAFQLKGADAYFGFNRTVKVKFAIEKEAELLTGLVIDNVSAGKAFIPGQQDPYSIWKALFEMRGNPNVTYPNNQGLVAYYRFSNNADDLSGNENIGTVHGPQLCPDMRGNKEYAYSFLRESDSISIQNSASLDINKSLTIAAWILPKDSNGVIVSKYAPGNIGGQQGGYSIGLRRGKISLALATKEPGLYFVDMPGVTKISLNEYHFVAGVYDFETNTIRLYLDGLLENETTFTRNVLGSNSLNILIGNRHDPSYSQDGRTAFQGIIDGVRIYNTCLTSSELNILMELAPW